MNDLTTHPTGEPPKGGELVAAQGPVAVDTFAGRVHVHWNPDAALTPLGQLPFFIDYLKTADLFDPWVEACPMTWTSPNAPNKRDVLGTVMLSILSGHQRYAHINALRSDGVNPELLGMEKIVSEDSVRRAFLKVDEAPAVHWLQNHLLQVTAPLWQIPWVLDIDVTVKTIYGAQEGAMVGYNPHKPGRPSHTYHTYLFSPLRLVLEVEVQDGKKGASKHSAPGLWALLERIPRQCWPALIRGDKDWGTERNMQQAEQRGMAYLFKQRLTKNTQRTIERLLTEASWSNAGSGWQGTETRLRLQGWSRDRRIVVLRRRLQRELMSEQRDRADPQQLRLSFTEVQENFALYEYAVLVTSLEEEIPAIAQLYRDRADAENPFDELKNHWGWGGFTTQDLKRCRLMARTTALIYNWWSLFVRLADPKKHTEAITSRPLLLSAIGRRTRHANQIQLTITASHAEAQFAERQYRRIAALLNSLRINAEQFNPMQRWCRILSEALIKYLQGRQLSPPPWLSAPG